ncbi:hypothetical protein TI05_11415, partial [Achromatium sp. WMS3]
MYQLTRLKLPPSIFLLITIFISVSGYLSAASDSSESPTLPIASIPDPKSIQATIDTTDTTNNTAQKSLAELQKQAYTLWEAGQKEQALVVIQTAINNYPDNIDNYFQRAVWLSELKRYDAAIADSRQALKLDPNNSDILGNLGWYLILKGDFAAAQDTTLKAQALAPQEMAWTVNLAHTYLLQGDKKTAQQWYTKSIQLLPDKETLESGPLADFDLFISKGWQVKTIQNIRTWYQQQAIIHFELTKATQLQIQAQNLSKQGKYAQALPLAQQSLAIREKVLGRKHPETATSLNNLAKIYQQQGQYTKAKPLYKLALAINEKTLGPQHPITA